MRGHGKAGFAHVVDRSGRLQVYFKSDVMGEQFKRYELLDVGDWIGVEGPLFRTRTGEITARADSVELLAKSIRPLPEKWQRPDGPRDALPAALRRPVREPRRARGVPPPHGDHDAHPRLLDQRGYLEVETPVLQPLYGGAFARPFVTRHNALDLDLYLRISNELYLKRLIVGGLDRVYEFSRNFRNEGMDRSHNPSSRCSEYYQAFADVHDMMDLTEALVCDALQATCGGLRVPYQGRVLDFTPPWPRVSMLDAVSEKVGESIHDLDEAKLGRHVAKHSLHPRAGTGAGGMLDELFSALVQPELQDAAFVVDFPFETSPLARASRKNRRWSSASSCSRPAWSSRMRSASRTTPTRSAGPSRRR